METLDPQAARDAQISAYLDDELDPDARAAFERDLAADPTLAAEVEELRGALGALHALRASPRPPDDFLRAVEGKINRRSRGRFFDQPEARMRVPYEVFAALMLVILAAAWLYAQPDDTAPDRGMAMGAAAAPPPPHPRAAR
jgi:anti-sigma factor RsiW